MSRRPVHELDPHIQAQLWDQWYAAAEADNGGLLGFYCDTYDFPVDRLGPRGTSALMEAAFVGATAAIQVLLEVGAKPNHQAAAGGSALHFAAAGGQLEALERLVAAGGEIDGRDHARGATPLLQATVRGHRALVEALLEIGADPFIEDGRGASALDLAIGGGDPGLLDCFLAADTRAWPPDWTSRGFWAACASGRLSVAEAFLARGANLDHRHPSGRNALHQSAQQGHTEVVRALLRLGLSPSEPSGTGWSPLLLAIKAGRFETAIALVEAGAEPNATEPGPQGNGITPLMHAAAQGQAELVKALLAAGADRAAGDEEQHRTAADWAEAGGHRALAEQLR